ncbi:hypothetical protein E4U55_001139 [Claviceps digitariae]|nr:hypothetical protein E4U55_001139 [Claviceps digitariae]
MQFTSLLLSVVLASVASAAVVAPRVQNDEGGFVPTPWHSCTQSCADSYNACMAPCNDEGGSPCKASCDKQNAICTGKC